MNGLTDSDVSINSFDNDISENFRSVQSGDTSRYDFDSKKFTAKLTRKYVHEHTQLGPRMAVMTCPNCLLSIESIVRYIDTGLTHVAAACLLPLGLCILPYCTPYFRNAEHYCPMCSVYLGTNFAEGGKALKCCATRTADN